MGTILIFQLERPIFLRELSNKMYVVSAYYLTKILAEIPVYFLSPLLMEIIVYFGIGLTVTAAKFFYFYLVMLLITLAASALGYFCSSIFTSPENAVGISPIILMPIMLFGGLFANSGSYPSWIGWIQYISPIRYGLEALVRNEFLDREMLPDVTNPVESLNFELGGNVCLIMLAVLAIFFRLVSVGFLKLLVRKFQ
jgi:ATP-binding cassette subfamily G (WHITE) protein 1